ncbi:MAG: copper-binding protein [Betaproteobacteria bacterium]|nr:copper-binding protein [Betaproteobacteria bacterium]
MPMPQGGKESAATHKGQGAVEAVDSVAGKLKLNHGPINSLKWPAMTMEFPVKDKKILKGVKPGMRVEFELAPDKDKNYAVIRIKPVQ